VKFNSGSLPAGASRRVDACINHGRSSDMSGRNHLLIWLNDITQAHALNGERWTPQIPPSSYLAASVPPTEAVPFHPCK
jgi:hypothetical protein